MMYHYYIIIFSWFVCLFLGQHNDNELYYCVGTELYRSSCISETNLGYRIRYSLTKIYYCLPICT